MRTHIAGPSEVRRYLPAACVLFLLVAALTGCQRAFYRERADAEAYTLIGEKAQYPRAQLPQFEIGMDPRSRMFDPFDPDYEPMPPDDPDSHQFMHCVDKKKGYPHWHANGEIASVENPHWYQFLPLNEDGVLVLDAETSVELALLHSRDYQRQLETLYLSALDVSFERFRFDSQFFGGLATDYRADGPLRSPAGSQSVLTVGTSPGGVRMEKLTTTGADILVGFANSLVWQFSGPDTYMASSLVDFSVIQPLLRGAGRDVIMERLTLAERTLLANVRQMERYRRGFYLEIVTGVDAGAGPSRRGGVFGAGLQGFTGVGGGFGGVTGGGGAVSGGGGTGGAQAGGFMGLLQTQQEIRNSEDNLMGQQQNYLQLLVELQEMLTTIPESTETVVRQRLQVAQAKQAALDAESRLINARVGYQNQLDSFKITLGLPPEICVKIEDSMLESVQLTDPAFREIRNQVGELQGEVGDVILGILQFSEDGTLNWSPELAAQLQALRDDLEGIEVIRQQLISGQDSQLDRVLADGIALGEFLEQQLEQAISAGGLPDARQDADLELLRADVALLRRVLQQFAEPDDWLQRLENFNLLRDAIDDLNRLRAELARGTVVNIDWMRTDANPWTQQAYRDFYEPVQSLNQATDTERPMLVNQLLTRLDQTVQPLEQRVQDILDANPWLGELDRWRVRPDDVEEAAASSQRIQIQRLERLFAQFVDAMIDISARLDRLPGKIRGYQEAIDALLADGPGLTPEELITRFRRGISPAIPQELVEFGNDVLELSLVQSRDRAETVSLVPIDLHPQAALEIARQNRRDWMNNRAALVDSWRLIEFNADELESSLDVVFSGDMGTLDDGPFKFSSATGRLRVGLEFDAPLTRLSERNNYRQSLIEFQQARRNYYAFQDQVSQGLRNIIRNLELNQRNFEIRRNAVRVADLQIEVNEDIRRLQEAAGIPSGPTAARDAIQALDALLRAQDDFLSVWVTYEVLRRTLDFNLGTMELDIEGMWIDPGPMGPKQGYPGIGDDSDCWPGPMVMPDGESPACVTVSATDEYVEVIPPGTPVPRASSSVEGGANGGENGGGNEPALLPGLHTLDAADGQVDAGNQAIPSDQEVSQPLPPPPSRAPAENSVDSDSGASYGLPLRAPAQ
jgi:hypothetical protein